MAAIWRRAWRSKKVSFSSMGLGRGDDGTLQTIFDSSSVTTTTTSGSGNTMTLTSSVYTNSSEPAVREEQEEEGSAMELRQEVVIVEKTRRHMRVLVDEFRAAGAADGNNASAALDRWLSELNVTWLLRLCELDASEQQQQQQRTFISRSRQLLQSPAQTSWIRALQVISTSVWKCLSELHSDDQSTVGPLPATDLAQFLKATLLKMLTFVDAIVALDPLNAGGASGGQQHVPSSSSSVVLVGTTEKVRALLDVRYALSAASEQIIMAFSSSLYVHSTKLVADDIGDLLSAKMGKLDQAIRDTFDHIRTVVTPSSLEDDNEDDSSARPRGATQPSLLQLQLQSSPDIHKVTRSVINYINDVLSNEALFPVKYAPDTCSLTTLAVDVLGYLEEELARVSQSLPDQSLRFIFLINNSHFIQQQLETSWPPHLQYLTYAAFFDSITNRINRYIKSYLQLAWAPVLKCLNIPIFNCFTRSSSLPKFESMFQTTYATQKLWKVPDPELRKRLRQAIIGKVVIGFRIYLKDNNRITPGVTPQELQEMLQELFEG